MSIDISWISSTTCKYYSIIICHKLLSLNVLTNICISYKLNAFFLHNIKLSVNYMLLKLHIRNSIS